MKNKLTEQEKENYLLSNNQPYCPNSHRKQEDGPILSHQSINMVPNKTKMGVSKTRIRSPLK